MNIYRRLPTHTIASIRNKNQTKLNMLVFNVVCYVPGLTLLCLLSGI